MIGLKRHRLLALSFLAIILVVIFTRHLNLSWHKAFKSLRLLLLMMAQLTLSPVFCSIGSNVPKHSLSDSPTMVLLRHAIMVYASHKENIFAAWMPMIAYDPAILKKRSKKYKLTPEWLLSQPTIRSLMSVAASFPMNPVTCQICSSQTTQLSRHYFGVVFGRK